MRQLVQPLKNSPMFTHEHPVLAQIPNYHNAPELWRQVYDSLARFEHWFWWVNVPFLWRIDFSFKGELYNYLLCGDLGTGESATTQKLTVQQHLKALDKQYPHYQYSLPIMHTNGRGFSPELFAYMLLKPRKWMPGELSSIDWTIDADAPLLALLSGLRHTTELPENLQWNMPDQAQYAKAYGGWGEPLGVLFSAPMLALHWWQFEQGFELCVKADWDYTKLPAIITAFVANREQQKKQTD